MYNTIDISPANIRFTQDSIAWRFVNGKSVNETLENIFYGRMEASFFPMITVVEKYGKYYSLDNRRLYVFRVLNRKGLLDYVTVLVDYVFDYSKFTTENDGVSLYVRGDRTCPHAITPTVQTSLSTVTSLSSASSVTQVSQSQVTTSDHESLQTQPISQQQQKPIDQSLSMVTSLSSSAPSVTQISHSQVTARDDEPLQAQPISQQQQKPIDLLAVESSDVNIEMTSDEVSINDNAENNVELNEVNANVSTTAQPDSNEAAKSSYSLWCLQICNWMQFFERN